VWRLRWWLRSRALIWIPTVALAVLTWFAVARLVGAAEARAARLGTWRVVAVVARPVNAGAVIGPGDIVWRRWPVALLPATPPAASPVGHAAIVALAPGSVVVAAWVAPTGLVGAAALVPAGWRALSVAVGPSGRPPVRVGDLVDVLASGEGVVVGGAHVVDVGTDTVTVAVPADASLRLASALAHSAVVLALVGQP
jgi:Flp pilus assembly protein CpaB